ncbi:hypothetical protein IM796_29765 [Streptomyces albidoflavus]|nr:hypothetical protein [Streptomyces albidoflavus]
MARGIAECTVLAGVPATLVARSPEKARLAADAVEASLTRSVRRGRVHPDDRARCPQAAPSQRPSRGVE